MNQIQIGELYQTLLSQKVYKHAYIHPHGELNNDICHILRQSDIILILDLIPVATGRRNDAVNYKIFSNERIGWVTYTPADFLNVFIKVAVEET